MKYRKKPVVIDALQWKGGDYEILNDFCGLNWGRAHSKDMANFEEKENVVLWNTKERQWLHCPINSFVIRGIDGELYPCAPDIFEKTYELVEPNQK